MIIVVNVRTLEGGFIKILLKITVCELPEVTLLLSGTDCATIFIPPEMFEIVNVPKERPVSCINRLNYLNLIGSQTMG